MTRLVRMDWPDNGTPDLPPAFSRAEAEGRLVATRGAMAAAGLEALVVYADREHAANLHWLTGFDPRFEEAVLVLTQDEALLLAGNECLPYAAASPLVAGAMCAWAIAPASRCPASRAARRALPTGWPR